MQAYVSLWKLMYLHASLCNCMQGYVTACKLMDMQSECKLMDMHAFWNLLEPSGTFWNILDPSGTFLNLLEHS